MGVQGLWSLLGPVARPTRLESLRNKRIAVDASIWIHQFMRTMRDNEGNELRNGHLLGFFRRLCKLLFFDIKPVFVFDGGAPTLKRITIVSIFLFYFWLCEVAVSFFLTCIFFLCVARSKKKKRRVTKKSKSNSQKNLESSTQM